MLTARRSWPDPHRSPVASSSPILLDRCHPSGRGCRVKAREATACGLALTRRPRPRQSSSEEDGTTERHLLLVSYVDATYKSAGNSVLMSLGYEQCYWHLACLVSSSVVSVGWADTWRLPCCVCLVSGCLTVSRSRIRLQVRAAACHFPASAVHGHLRTNGWQRCRHSCRQVRSDTPH